MSCVLRAHGESFKVREFLEKSSLQLDTVYEKGDPIDSGKKNGSHRPSSGFSAVVSQADFSDLEEQVREAILFLDEYEEDLRRLGSFKGVEAVFLDFGVQWREASVQTDVFPADVLWRAGALDIWLAVTHYFIAGEREDADRRLTS
jgi:hypothetical protein